MQNLADDMQKVYTIPIKIENLANLDVQITYDLYGEIEIVNIFGYAVATDGNLVSVDIKDYHTIESYEVFKEQITYVLHETMAKLYLDTLSNGFLSSQGSSIN